MWQLEQNHGDEEEGRMSEQGEESPVCRKESTQSFMMGEEAAVGVKVGYIRTPFSRVTLKLGAAGSDAITSSRYKTWSRAWPHHSISLHLG